MYKFSRSRFNLHALGEFKMELFEDFMGYHETAAYVGFSCSKLVNLVKNGAFPKALRTENGIFLGWTKSQLIEWQQSLIKKSQLFGIK